MDRSRWRRSRPLVQTRRSGDRLVSPGILQRCSPRQRSGLGVERVPNIPASLTVERRVTARATTGMDGRECSHQLRLARGFREPSFSFASTTGRFGNDGRGLRLRGGRRRRQRECHPKIKAVRPVAVGELAIAFEVQVALHVSDRKQVSQLRTDADDERFKRTQKRPATAVRCYLVVNVSNGADKYLLGQKLRRSPIEMEINAAGVVSHVILEISR